MTQQQIIRAWKDPEFRASLSDAERTALPAHPAGLVEMNDADMMDVSGGTTVVCVSVVVSVLLLMDSCSGDT
jgi:mersacidin/lichenicidin family type 2 lantibiotic